MKQRADVTTREERLWNSNVLHQVHVFNRVIIKIIEINYQRLKFKSLNFSFVVFYSFLKFLVNSSFSFPFFFVLRYFAFLSGLLIQNVEVNTLKQVRS
jgi:hypothetical protein